MNKVMIVGRVGKDPETRDVGTHTVAEFTVATDKPNSEQPDWHRVKFWDPKGVINYIRRGTWVAIDGRIETRSYEANDGGTRHVTEIVVGRLELVGSRPQQGGQQPRHQQQAPTQQYQNNDFIPPGPEEDDVPW